MQPQNKYFKSMKNIIILFGEMGSGKNYWGEQIARDMNYTFYDGDLAAPQEVIEKISRFKPLNRELVFHFVNQLCETIIEKAPAAKGLVVGQALYFDEDRKYVAKMLGNLGYNVTFRWVRPPFWRNMKQIYSRPNGSKWVLYWLRNKRWFQKPTHEYILIK